MSDVLPKELVAASARVTREAERFLAAERDRWRTLDADLDDLLAALERTVLAGGKRIRPALCYWGWRCALPDRLESAPHDGDVASRDEAEHDHGASPNMDEPVVRAGLALELLHAFALVHDDVMDDAATRRGMPTTHVHFEGAHTGSAWRGEPRRFGESMGILVGDLAHVYADLLMADMPAATRELWRQMQLELVAGQYLDVLGTARGEVTKPQARLIARMKSGRYTIVAPLRIGASLGASGTDEPAPGVDRTLMAYGEPLGAAFQLRDDVLGAFGDPERLGKPVGADLREGKPTVLLASAWELADSPQRAALERIGAPDLSDEEIVALQQTVQRTGALEVVEAEIDQLTSEAIAVVHAAPLPAAARAALVSIARFISTRQH